MYREQDAAKSLQLLNRVKNRHKKRKEQAEGASEAAGKENERRQQGLEKAKAQLEAAKAKPDETPEAEDDDDDTDPEPSPYATMLGKPVQPSDSLTHSCTWQCIKADTSLHAETPPVPGSIHCLFAPLSCSHCTARFCKVRSTASYIVFTQLTRADDST